MTFPYKKIAIFGATSGIGRALAERFIENGVFVIAIGRRHDRLNALVDKYGRDKVHAAVFDITDIDAIPDFATKLVTTHSDLDLVFLNSGVQRTFDFSAPESVNLNTFKEELETNYFAQIAVTQAFLPFLISRAKSKRPAALMYTTSGLALVPRPTVLNYSASKAAMHSFILSLREQLVETGVKVIEIVPAAIQTELRGENGRGYGMPLSEFTDETWQKLLKGEDQLPIGSAASVYDKLEESRQELFRRLVEMSKEQK